MSKEEFSSVLDVSAASIQVANADKVKNIQEWSIRGIPPFGYDTDVPIIIDETLRTFETVWGGAGTNFAMDALDPDTLVEQTDAVMADISEP